MIKNSRQKRSNKIKLIKNQFRKRKNDVLFVRLLNL